MSAVSDYRGLAPMDFSGNLSENWKLWKQKFENYMVASEIGKKDEKIQIAQLLHYIGEEGFNIYNTFTYESDEDRNKVCVVIKKFDNHFLPKRNLSYERFKFFTRKQLINESIEQFVTDLKNKARSCEFGELKDNLIKDIFTCGLQNHVLREHLLQDDSLNLEKAVKYCVSVENSKEQSTIITQRTSSSASLDVQAVGKPKCSNSSSTKRGSSSGSHFVQQRQVRQPGGKFQNSKCPPSSSSTTSRLRGNNGICSRCGSVHGKNQCPAFGKKCNLCGFSNHFAKMCLRKNVNLVENCQNENVDNNDYVFIGSVDFNNTVDNSWYVSLIVNNNFIKFKLDSGAQANLITDKMLHKINFNSELLEKTEVKLKSYTNNNLPVLGKCSLICKYKNWTGKLDFFVVEDNNYQCILGLESCIKLNLIKRIDVLNDSENLSHKNSYDKLIRENIDLFTGLGCLNQKYHIELNENAKPVVHPPRKIPFPLLDQFKSTLNQMEKQKIIKKLNEPTDWVNSFVIVRKKNGTLRICLDPSDLNNAIKREYFQLPTLDQIISNLSGACVFSTLDANSGFWQIALDKESTKLCTFATPFGRYCFLRLPYGIKSAPEVFHKHFKNIFTIQGVELYIDDIIIWGRTQAEHDKRLNEVFKIARQHNVTFNKDKCKFGLSEINYMGHKITKNGYSPDENKLKAIKEMPLPQNKKEVQRFLGMITYVGRFIPNLSNLTSSLRNLIKNDIIFEWTNHHTKSFNELKNLLTKPPVLQYYDINKEVVISVDASKDGVGACLLQNKLPCAYASKALTETQTRWAQIEKELYAIFFGCDRFYEYVYGKKFIVETDHKPLLGIFKKPLASCPARLQRMLIQLKKYDFEIVYKPGKELFVADTLSRAYIQDDKNVTDFENDLEICVIDMNFNLTNKKSEEILNATLEDSELKLLKQFVENGWPNKVSKVPLEIRNYYKCKNEITERNGLLFKSQQLIIPKKLRRDIINKIHYCHLGIQKCKKRANSCFYWPGMSKQLEDTILSCKICLTHRVTQQKETLIPHDIPSIPWYKIGCDILYLGNIMYLLVIDYYTKWVELILLDDNSHSRTIIKHLKSIFSRFGIPAILISDNGPQFKSVDFKIFSDEYEFTHITSSPNYPQSNGMVERQKQTLKKILCKAIQDKKDLDLVLLMYRNSPLESGFSPAELLMSRHLRDILPTTQNYLKPKHIPFHEYNRKIKLNQSKQKKYYDKNSKNRKPISNNQNVRFQNKPKSKWEFGKVINRSRNRSYVIKRNNDTSVTRNRRFIEPIPSTSKDVDLDDSDIIEISDSENENSLQSSPENILNNNSPQNTRCGRLVKKPDRLIYS